MLAASSKPGELVSWGGEPHNYITLCIAAGWPGNKGWNYTRCINLDPDGQVQIVNWCKDLSKVGALIVRP